MVPLFILSAAFITMFMHLIDLPRWLPSLIRSLQQSNQRSNAKEISEHSKLLDHSLDYSCQHSRFALHQKPTPTA